jgi:hypothetical protein
MALLTCCKPFRTRSLPGSRHCNCKTSTQKKHPAHKRKDEQVRSALFLAASKEGFGAPAILLLEDHWASLKAGNNGNVVSYRVRAHSHKALWRKISARRHRSSRARKGVRLARYFGRTEPRRLCCLPSYSAREIPNRKCARITALD